MEEKKPEVGKESGATSNEASLSNNDAAKIKGLPKNRMGWKKQGDTIVNHLNAREIIESLISNEGKPMVETSMEEVLPPAEMMVDNAVKDEDGVAQNKPHDGEIR